MGVDHLKWAKSGQHHLAGVDPTSRAAARTTQRRATYGFASELGRGMPSAPCPMSRAAGHRRTGAASWPQAAQPVAAPITTPDYLESLWAKGYTIAGSVILVAPIGGWGIA